MRNLYILNIFIISLFNCKEKVNNQNETLTIDEANSIGQVLYKTPPNTIEFAFVYLIDDKNYIHEVDYSYLKSIYEMEYDTIYKSLGLFIYSIVNQNLKLKEIDFVKTSIQCKLNQNIFNEFKDLNKEKFINKYFYIDDKSKGIILKSDTLSICEKENLSYYLFSKRYNRNNINDDKLLIFDKFENKFAIFEKAIE